MRSQIETPTDSHIVRYEPAVATAIAQMDVFWPAEELGVECDIPHFKTLLNQGESYAVRYFQSLLTKYETFIGGQDLWANEIPTLFPRPEIQRACSVISMVENHSHAPFYALADQAMGNATDEFYSKWRNDPVLTGNINYILSLVKQKDALVTTAVLAMLEGVNLFSILGFFKCFNTRGFNLIPHFVSGIDASAKDENFHSMFSSYLHNQCKLERNLTVEEEATLASVIEGIYVAMLAHEHAIINHVFDYSDSLPPDQRIRVCKRKDIIDFSYSRASTVMNYLGHPMPVVESTIADDFYTNLNSFKYSDFFATTQVQYRRNYAMYKIGYNPKAREML
jgi:ribonucleotide reductase beta subunit family protein with ferritin-like domain